MGHPSGKERDGETGLDYFGARYLSSRLGRFMSPDPENASSIGNEDDPQSWNGYAYARNNPLSYTDPTGEKYKVCQSAAPGFEFNCNTEVSDKEFEQLQKDKNLQIFGGNIYAINQGGSRTLIGTYQQLEPDLSQSAQMILGSPVLGQARTVAIGALIGTGVVVSGGLAYAALSGAATTELGITGLRALSRQALNRLLGNAQRELIRNFFKTRLLPPGIEPRTLRIYAEIARRAIAEGKDKLGVQAERLKLIEEALKKLGG